MRIMQKITILSIIILSTNYLYSQGYYDSIPSAQFQALNISPYRDAKGALFYIDSQKVFRKTEFPEVINKILLRSQKLADTLLIVEEFSDDCFGCQSFRCEILYRDTLYMIKRKAYEFEDYKKSKLIFSSAQSEPEFITKHHEIFEVRSRISKRMSWKSESLKYGGDGCNDGSHTLLTMLLPIGAVESLYVRCWYDWYGKKID
jgi:hypothetical protein